MRRLVETLEPSTTSQSYRTCDKQLRLFRALYDVAVKYIEVKTRSDGGQGEITWPMAQQQFAGGFAGVTSAGFGLSTLDPGALVGGADAPSGHMSLQPEANRDGAGLIDGPTALQTTAFGDVDMDMDLSGAQLWDWFNKNQSIMRMLEDT